MSTILPFLQTLVQALLKNSYFSSHLISLCPPEFILQNKFRNPNGVAQNLQRRNMMTTRLNKTILALAAISMLGAGSVLAGKGPGDGSCDGSEACDGKGGGNNQQMQQRGGPADHMAKMANRFGLTLEQQIKALELFDLHQQDRAQVRERMFEDYGVEVCAQRDQHREEFRALLNDEQKALHDEMAQRRGNRENRNGGGFGGFECPVAADTEAEGES
jgi:hypothetical protein